MAQKASSDALSKRNAISALQAFTDSAEQAMAPWNVSEPAPLLLDLAGLHNALARGNAAQNQAQRLERFLAGSLFFANALAEAGTYSWSISSEAPVAPSARPLKGLIRPFKGLIRPFKGRIRPLRALYKALKRLIRPFRAL